jgi:glycine/serine hydroxymethyltransferase
MSGKWFKVVAYTGAPAGHRIDMDEVRTPGQQHKPR